MLLVGGVLPDNTLFISVSLEVPLLALGEEEIVSLVHNYHIGGANPDKYTLRGFRGNPPDRGFRGQRSPLILSA